jgi:enoyl-CoA hydratase
LASLWLVQEGGSVSDPKKGPDASSSRRGHKLIVTMNRPEARNALSGEMLAIMVEAWDRVDDDPEIRSAS